MGVTKKNRGKDSTPLAWKSMQLGGDLISKGIEGLIGIEELTVYSLSKKKSPFSKDVVVTKVRKSDLKKGKKVPTQDEQKEKSLVSLSTSEIDTSTGVSTEDREKREIKRARKLLREAKKKKKKRELKLNMLDKKKKGKSVPSSSFIEAKTDNSKENAASLGTPTNIRDKNKIRQKNEKKWKKQKLKYNKQTMQKNAETSVSADLNAETISLTANIASEKIKRKLTKSAADEPTNKKKKKNNDLGMECEASSTNLEAKIKKPRFSKKDKLRTKKILLKNTVVPKKNISESETYEENSGVEENDSFAEEIPANSIRGMESWAGLNLPDSILRALAENGFKKPTEIQACSLPAAVLGRRDIMGAAETGSGKTLAFAIPILYGILQQKKRDLATFENGTSKDLLKDESDTEDVSKTQDPESDSEADARNSFNDDGSEEMEVNDDGIGCVKVIDNADFSFMTDSVSSVKEKPANSKYNQKLYALVLTPTRELAMQVKDHIAAAAKYTGIRVTVVIGGLAHQKQERLLKTKPEIVVATPGRLWELIQEGNTFLQHIDDISFLAIDETDRMIEKGHFQELQQLLLRINENEEKKKQRQNFVFSATLTMVHEPPQRKKTSGKKQQMRVTPGQKLQDVIKMLGIKQPKVVDVTQESGTARTLQEAQIKCTFDEKDVYLYYFLVRNPGRTLIFCNSISCVRRLAQILTILKCKPLPIHANMVQRQRLKNLDRFRANPTGLLLATDVAARGLDIPNVEHVVHYQVPRTSEGYVHRSGRTARASKGGLTVLLIEPAEQQSFTRLCRTLGRANELPAFEVSQDLLSAAKERVHLARDIDHLELTSKKSDAELGWYQKALADMDMVLDENELPSRISDEDSARNRRASAVKRKQLESLLSRPLFTRR